MPPEVPAPLTSRRISEVTALEALRGQCQAAQQMLQAELPPEVTIRRIESFLSPEHFGTTIAIQVYVKGSPNPHAAIYIDINAPLSEAKFPYDEALARIRLLT